MLATGVFLFFSPLSLAALDSKIKITSAGQKDSLFSQESKYPPYLEIGGAKYFNQNSNVAGIYDLFIPLAQSEDQLFFSDLRIFDRSGSSFEGNAHFGFRKLFLDRKELFGVYAAFDRKRGESHHWYNQLTIGGEYWHDNWFIGGNLYRTIGKKEVLINEGSFEAPIASGVDIGVARTITTKGSYERSLSGLDAEVGYTFTDNLTGYIGGYYFTEHNAATTAGPKVRFTYNYSHPTGRFLGILDGISIEAGAQHDKPRGNTAYLGIKFKVGLTNLGNDKGKNSNLFGFERHMTELVRRDPDIVTGRQDFATSERKIDFARLEIQDLPQDILLAEFGLPQDATLKEVEKKYREYAKRHHPDRKGGGDSEEFARYSHLYEVIREKFQDDKGTFNYQPHQSGGVDIVNLNINGNNSPNFLPALFDWSLLQRMSDSMSLAIQQKPIFAPIRWINNFSNQLFDLFFPIKGVYAIGLGDSLLSSQGIGGALSRLGLELLPPILSRESLSMDRQIGVGLHQYDLLSGAVTKNQDLVSQPSLDVNLQEQDLNCNFTVFGRFSGFSGIMGYSSLGGTENIGDRVNIELCERSSKGCNINYRDVPLYAKSDFSLLFNQTDSQIGYEVVLPTFDEVVVPQPQEESLNLKTTVFQRMDESVVPQSKKVLFFSDSEISSSHDLKLLSSNNLEVLFSRDSKMLSSRDLIAGSLSQDQLPIKETPQLMLFSDSYSQEINPDYEYEAQDMDVLLPLRAKEAQLDLKNIVILPSIEDKELENQLLIENFKHLEKSKYDQDKIDISHERDLLIPVNLPDKHHWVGVIVRIDEFNNPYAAYYLDSLSDSSLQSQSEVSQVFHRQGIKFQRARGLIQCDSTSCGPVAIENLIRVTSRLRRKEDLDVTDDSSLMLNEEETKKIRKAHINLSEKYAPSLRLKYRQKYNLRTFEYLSDDGRKLSIEIPMESLFQKLDTEKEFNRKLMSKLVNNLLFPRSQFNLVSAVYGGGRISPFLMKKLMDLIDKEKKEKDKKEQKEKMEFILLLEDNIQLDKQDNDDIIKLMNYVYGIDKVNVDLSEYYIYKHCRKLWQDSSGNCNTIAEYLMNKMQFQPEKKYRDYEGDNRFHLVAKGKLDIWDFELWLKHKSYAGIYLNEDINTLNKEGFTPLELAVMGGKEDVVSLFLDKKYIVKFVFDDKSMYSTNEKLQLYTIDSLGRSVHYAAQGGYLVILKIMVENSPDLFRDCVNKHDTKGYTPICLAVLNDYSKIVEYLADNGAYVDSVRLYSTREEYYSLNTPLMLAVKKGDLESVNKILTILKKQTNSKDVFLTNINFCNHDGDTALHIAARGQHVSLIKELLEKGADVNIKNIKGEFALRLVKNKEKLHEILDKIEKDKDIVAPQPEVNLYYEYDDIDINALSMLNITEGELNLPKGGNNIEKIDENELLKIKKDHIDKLEKARPEIQFNYKQRYNLDYQSVDFGYNKWLVRFVRFISAYKQKLIGDEDLLKFQLFLLEMEQFNANFTIEELKRLNYPRSPFAMMHRHAYLRATETWVIEIFRAKYFELNNKSKNFPLWVDSSLYVDELKKYSRVISKDEISEDGYLLKITREFLNNMNRVDLIWIEVNNLYDAITIKEKIKSKMLSEVCSKNNIPDNLCKLFEDINNDKNVEVSNIDEVLNKLNEHFPEVLLGKQKEREEECKGLKNSLDSGVAFSSKDSRIIFKIVKSRHINLPNEQIKNPNDLCEYANNNTQEFREFLSNIIKDKTVQKPKPGFYVESIKGWISKYVNKSFDNFLDKTVYYFQDEFVGVNVLVCVGCSEVPKSVSGIVGNSGYRLDQVKAEKEILKKYYPKLFIDYDETKKFWDDLLNTGNFKTNDFKEEYKLIEHLSNQTLSALEQIKDRGDQKKQNNISIKTAGYLFEEQLNELILRLSKTGLERTGFDLYGEFLFNYLEDYKDQYKNDVVMRQILDYEIYQSLGGFLQAWDSEDLPGAIKNVQAITDVLLFTLRDKGLPEGKKSLEKLVRKKYLKKYPVQGVLFTPYAMRSYIRIFQILDPMISDEFINKDGKFNIYSTNQSYYELLGNLEKLENGQFKRYSVSFFQHTSEIDQEANVIFLEIHPNNVMESVQFSHNFIDLLGDMKNWSGKRTLVIDATLNALDDDEIKGLLYMASSMISSGNLNFVLIQSLTKFVQLGLDKRSGGVIIFINNGGDYWSLVNNQIKKFDKGGEYYRLEHIDKSTLNFFSYFYNFPELIKRYIELINRNVRYLYGAIISELNKLEVSSTKRLQVTTSSDRGACYVALSMRGLFSEVDEGFILTTEDVEDFSRDVLKHMIIPLCEYLKLSLAERMSIGFPLSNINYVLDSLRFTVGLEPEAQLKQYAQVLGYVSFSLNISNDPRLFFHKNENNEYEKRHRYFKDEVARFKREEKFISNDKIYFKSAVFFDHSLSKLWNTKIVYGPFFVKDYRCNVYFLFYNKQIRTFFNEAEYPESNILVKKGDIVITLNDLSLEEKEFLFREYEYKESGGNTDFSKFYPNEGRVITQMIPNLEDIFTQLSFDKGNILVERDFTFYKHKKGVTAYKRFSWYASDASPTTIIEVDFWGIKSPVLARFLRLLTAVYVKEKGNLDFSVYDNLFSKFIFKRLSSDLQKYDWDYVKKDKRIYDDKDDNKDKIIKFIKYIENVFVVGAQQIVSKKTVLKELLDDYNSNNKKAVRLSKYIVGHVKNYINDCLVSTKFDKLLGDQISKDRKINMLYEHIGDEIKKCIKKLYGGMTNNFILSKRVDKFSEEIMKSMRLSSIHISDRMVDEFLLMKQKEKDVVDINNDVTEDFLKILSQIIEKIIQKSTNYNDLLSAYLLRFYRVADDVNERYNFSDKDKTVLWPSGHSGIDYVSDKDLIDEAIKILKDDYINNDQDDGNSSIVGEDLETETKKIPSTNDDRIRQKGNLFDQDNYSSQQLVAPFIGLQENLNQIDSEFIQGKKLSSVKPKQDESSKDVNEINKIIKMEDGTLYKETGVDLKVKTVRYMPGWEFQDVEGDGNCFFRAIAHQLILLKHNLVNEVPQNTYLYDVLRLRVSDGLGVEFKDRDWSGDVEALEFLVRHLDVTIALVDIRPDKRGINEYRYYYLKPDNSFGETKERAEIPIDKPIVRLTYNGTHYMSVTKDKI